MTITRSQAAARTHLWPKGVVAYSQSALRGDGYRTDCSGFYSMCIGLDRNKYGWGGANTVTLVTSGILSSCKYDDLETGDALGHCGPGTGGDAGHVMFFIGWKNLNPNDPYALIAEMTPDYGPSFRLVDCSYWTPYRCNRVVDDPVINYYMIRAGDTLSSIAAKYHTTIDKLWIANNVVLNAAAKKHGLANSDHGNMIYPGTRIVIP